MAIHRPCIEFILPVYSMKKACRQMYPLSQTMISRYTKERCLSRRGGGIQLCIVEMSPRIAAAELRTRSLSSAGIVAPFQVQRPCPLRQQSFPPDGTENT